jgi:hypothetical protein
MFVNCAGRMRPISSKAPICGRSSELTFPIDCLRKRTRLFGHGLTQQAASSSADGSTPTVEFSRGQFFGWHDTSFHNARGPDTVRVGPRP